MQQQNSVTVTINNPTAGQLLALNDILESTPERDEAAQGKKAGKRGKPTNTVSEDEDENFGKKPFKAKDLDESEEDGESEDDDTEESEDGESEDGEDADSEEDDEAEVSFDDVKKAINKYGEKNPDQMKAILAAFGFKSTKELERAPKKWDAVYRKVQAKLTAKKKTK